MNKCAPRKCVVCGKVFDYIAYGGDSRDVCSSACFTDKFWIDIINEKDLHPVIDGKCYYIGDEKSVSSFRGFDGRRFKLQMIDSGEIIESTNLWYNGDVPEKFRDQLPDTAKFIR